MKVCLKYLTRTSLRITIFQTLQTVKIQQFQSVPCWRQFLSGWEAGNTGARSEATHRLLILAPHANV